MATKEITISELELAKEVLADMTLPVDTATETKATTLGAIKEWIEVGGEVLKAVPVGVVLPFGGVSAPQGFLLCNGSTISRTTYSKLFSVIGTTYGAGDGSTTFALPNLSSARMVTSSTVSVKGNGKTLGMTDGATNGAFTFGSSYGEFLVAGGFNKNVGTKRSTTDYITTDTYRGVTTDASKSGLTGTASLASSVKFIIKY